MEEIQNPLEEKKLEPQSIMVSKLIQGQQLEGATRDGWRIVSIHQQDAEFEYEHSELVDAGGGRTYRQTMADKKVGTRVMFLVEKSQTLISHEQLLYNKAYQAERLAAGLGETVKDLRAGNEDLTRKYDRAAQNWLSAKRDAELLQSSVRKLENDIAKIRKELGDGRMREILDKK